MTRKVIGIIGFGNQGKPWAQNLRDRGWSVHILLKNSSPSRQKVLDQGFEVASLETDISKFPFLGLLIPDDAMSDFFEAHGAKLTKNQTLIFAHGFCLHFKTISLPAEVDAILLAPKGIGSEVRHEFVSGRGVPFILAVVQDVSGSAKQNAVKLAHDLGAEKAGIYEATVQQEVETDLFSEQALLCGGIPQLVLKTFEILVQKGISPELAYLECVHELGFMAKLFQQKGFFQTLQGASSTAKFGGMTAGEKLIDDAMAEKLESLFVDIRQGTFRKNLLQESSERFPYTMKKLKEIQDHPAEKAGEAIRQKIYQGEKTT